MQRDSSHGLFQSRVSVRFGSSPRLTSLAQHMPNVLLTGTLPTHSQNPNTTPTAPRVQKGTFSPGSPAELREPDRLATRLFSAALGHDSLWARLACGFAHNDQRSVLARWRGPGLGPDPWAAPPAPHGRLSGFLSRLLTTPHSRSCGGPNRAVQYPSHWSAPPPRCTQDDCVCNSRPLPVRSPAPWYPRLLGGSRSHPIP